MLALPPTWLSDLPRQVDTQRNDLPYPIADQTAFSWIVDIGFDDERISTNTLGSFIMKFLTLTDNRVINLCNCRWLQLDECVVNSSRAEAHVVNPLADAEHGPKRAMVLSLILKLVEIEVATEANAGQHNDLPVIKSGSAYIATRVYINVLGHQANHFVPERTGSVDVLQSSKNGNHFVTTIVVEHQFGNWCTIKSALLFVMSSHANTPRRFAFEIAITLHFQRANTAKGSIFGELFYKKDRVF
jgi:hypothetical protein